MNTEWKIRRTDSFIRNDSGPLGGPCHGGRTALQPASPRYRGETIIGDPAFRGARGARLLLEGPAFRAARGARLLVGDPAFRVSVALCVPAFCRDPAFRMAFRAFGDPAFRVPDALGDLCVPRLQRVATGWTVICFPSSCEEDHESNRSYMRISSGKPWSKPNPARGSRGLT